MPTHQQDGVLTGARLREHLEFTGDLIASAISHLDDYPRGVREGDVEMMLAYTAAFREQASILAAEAEQLHAFLLSEWHATTEYPRQAVGRLFREQAAMMLDEVPVDAG